MQYAVFCVWVCSLIITFWFVHVECIRSYVPFYCMVVFHYVIIPQFASSFFIGGYSNCSQWGAIIAKVVVNIHIQDVQIQIMFSFLLYLLSRWTLGHLLGINIWLTWNSWPRMEKTDYVIVFFWQQNVIYIQRVEDILHIPTMKK